MTGAVAIRPGRAADHAAVAALLERVFVGGGFTRPEHASGLATARHGVPGTTWLVAEDAATATIVGSIHLGTTESPFVQAARADEAEIGLLAVDAVARGRGAGEALVRAAVADARARGCFRVVLSTQPTMHAAHRLYERCGFRRAPDRDWERHGGARLVYALDVTGAEPGALSRGRR